MSDPTGQAIESVLREERVFAPPAAFAARAGISGLAEYDALYRRSVEDPDGFWAETAQRLRWSTQIMRRLLRDIAAGQETLGDTTTLEDYSVLARLREDEE